MPRFSPPSSGTLVKLLKPVHIATGKKSGPYLERYRVVNRDTVLMYLGYESERDVAFEETDYRYTFLHEEKVSTSRWMIINPDEFFIENAKVIPMTNESEENILVELNSTNLKEAEYDPFMQTLILRFKTGGDYEYIDVPKEVFDDLVKAESAGKFFHSKIRGKFEFLKVTNRPVAADFKEAEEPEE